jgi:hypothetical protein
MPTKQEIYERISKLLMEKSGGAAKPCSVCGQIQWMVADKYVRFHATRDPNQFSTESGIGFPIQPVICGHCGNTHFINLLVLGIPNEELASIVYPQDDATNQK